eukprot:3706751-Amphidinium_carterae.2
MNLAQVSNAPIRTLPYVDGCWFASAIARGGHYDMDSISRKIGNSDKGSGHTVLVVFNTDEDTHCRLCQVTASEAENRWLESGSS